MRYLGLGADGLSFSQKPLTGVGLDHGQLELLPMKRYGGPENQTRAPTTVGARV